MINISYKRTGLRFFMLVEITGLRAELPLIGKMAHTHGIRTGPACS